MFGKSYPLVNDHIWLEKGLYLKMYCPRWTIPTSGPFSVARHTNLVHLSEDVHFRAVFFVVDRSQYISVNIGQSSCFFRMFPRTQSSLGLWDCIIIYKYYICKKQLPFFQPSHAMIASWRASPKIVDLGTHLSFGCVALVARLLHVRHVMIRSSTLFSCLGGGFEGWCFRLF